MEDTPHRLRAAVRCVEKETWMDLPDKVSFIQMLQRDKSAVSVYASLENEELRREWIKAQLLRPL